MTATQAKVTTESFEYIIWFYFSEFDKFWLKARIKPDVLHWATLNWLCPVFLGMLGQFTIETLARLLRTSVKVLLHPLKFKCSFYIIFYSAEIRLRKILRLFTVITTLDCRILFYLYILLLLQYWFVTPANGQYGICFLPTIRDSNLYKVLSFKCSCVYKASLMKYF